MKDVFLQEESASFFYRVLGIVYSTVTIENEDAKVPSFTDANV